jgi:hypothetical protein
MARYQIDVVEVRHVSCTYTVEADNPTEAREKAEMGETEEEIENGPGDVNERFINGTPVEVE